MSSGMGEHGIRYTARDGSATWDLDRFLARSPRPVDLPRPERDVLRSLLLFCIEGLDGLDVRERYEILLPTATFDPAWTVGGQGD